METPTRPFTVGGRTLSQARQASAQVTPASEPKKTVSFNKSAVFPSPPAHRASPGQLQRAQDQAYQQQYPQQQHTSTSHTSNGYGQAAGIPVASTSSSVLPRSTSAPHILPPPTTLSSGPSLDRAVNTFSHSSSSQLATTSLDQSKQQTAQSAQKQRRPPTNQQNVTVDPRLAFEARKANMAKRLRVNLVMLLAWYLITDSRLYSYLAEQAVSNYPSTRTPMIWLLQRILPGLLLYNAGEAFLTIRSNKMLPSTGTSASLPQDQSVQSAIAGPACRAVPITTATYKSSPKTRPSTNMVASPGMPVRKRATSGSHASEEPASLPPPSHRSSPGQIFRPEAGLTESPTSALRRALLSASGKTSSLASSTSMPAGLSGLSGQNAGSPTRDKTDPRVQAYWLRNESQASPLHRSVRTAQDIDRLLETVSS